MPDGEGASVSLKCCSVAGRSSTWSAALGAACNCRHEHRAAQPQKAYIQLVEQRRPGRCKCETSRQQECLRTSSSDEHFFQKASPLLRCRRLSISGRFCKTTSCMAFGAVTLPLRRQSWQNMCTAYRFGSQFFYAAGWLTIPHRNLFSSFDTTRCSTFVNA